MKSHPVLKQAGSAAGLRPCRHCTSPITQKHVGILLPKDAELKTLGLLASRLKRAGLRCEICQLMTNAVRQAIEGDLCGVVWIKSAHERAVWNTNVHEELLFKAGVSKLKRPLLFPPIEVVSVADPTNLSHEDITVVCEKARTLLEGNFCIDGEIPTEQNLRGVFPHMHVPNMQTSMLAVRHRTSGDSGVDRILNHWPGVAFQGVAITEIANTHAPQVLLIDELGTDVLFDVVAHYEAKGFAGTVGVIGAGTHFAHASAHFGGRREAVLKECRATLEFVRFVNTLIHHISAQ